MTCVNPSKRQLKTETTGEGKDRVVVPINEIRKAVTVVTPATAFSPAVEEPIVFDPATETLQIVDDKIVVVPRPAPPVVVPDTVDRWKLKTVLQADGKWDNVLAVADTLPAEQKPAVINGLEGAATINRNHALVQMMIAIPALDITAEEMDEYYVATKQFD